MSGSTRIGVADDLAGPVGDGEAQPAVDFLDGHPAGTDEGSDRGSEVFGLASVAAGHAYRLVEEAARVGGAGQGAGSVFPKCPLQVATNLADNYGWTRPT